MSVHVVDSLFRDNDNYNCTTFGGGAFFSLRTSFRTLQLKNVHYLAGNVSFLNNTARLGGAVYYLSDRNKRISMNSMEFDNCVF